MAKVPVAWRRRGDTSSIGGGRGWVEANDPKRPDAPPRAGKMEPSYRQSVRGLLPEARPWPRLREPQPQRPGPRAGVGHAGVPPPLPPGGGGGRAAAEPP